MFKKKTKEKSKGRIGIVNPGNAFGRHHILRNMVTLLKQAGYVVDIFTPPLISSSELTEDIKEEDLITISKIRERKHLFKYVPGKFIIIFEAIKRHRVLPYRCLIGIDIGGLMTSKLISRYIKVPFIYCNLELLVSNDLINNKDKKRLKPIERRLCSESAFIISLGSERSAILAEDNQIDPAKIVNVPNSPLGTARRLKKNLWHEYFGIEKHKSIVLHGGSISSQFGLTEIIRSTSDWPPNWDLVIHTLHGKNYQKEIDHLKSLAPEARIHFSVEPVTNSHYEELLDSANIGILFYITKSINGSNLGLSSGKLASYLHAGLPVIMNNIATTSKIIQSEGAGIIVTHGNQIGNAIREIEKDNETYSFNAIHLFNSQFLFEKGFEEVLDRIERFRCEKPTCEY